VSEFAEGLLAWIFSRTAFIHIPLDRWKQPQTSLDRKSGFHYNNKGFPEKSCILDFMRFVRLVASQLRVDETFLALMA
jgi:hypothetical protein